MPKTLTPTFDIPRRQSLPQTAARSATDATHRQLGGHPQYGGHPQAGHQASVPNHVASARGLLDVSRRVSSSLRSLGYASLTHIECLVDADRIILNGTVSSYHLKQMAQVAALRVAGAYRVDNCIVVQ